MQNPPPGARGFFLADEVGGSGWEIEMPDGRVEKFYVGLPESLKITTWFEFPDAPREHLGEPITDRSVSNLAHLYIRYLTRLVADAETEFQPSGE
jgi:hypothetical protein